MAIDLGAAPGGWSAFLVKKGFKVVAIDKGGLDTAALAAGGIKVSVVSLAKTIKPEELSADIVHIKGDSKGALRGPEPNPYTMQQW